MVLFSFLNLPGLVDLAGFLTSEVSKRPGKFTQPPQSLEEWKYPPLSFLLKSISFQYQIPPGYFGKMKSVEIEKGLCLFLNLPGLVDLAGLFWDKIIPFNIKPPQVILVFLSVINIDALCFHDSVRMVSIADQKYVITGGKINSIKWFVNY